MSKNYQKIEFKLDTTLAECVLELVQYAVKGQFVCGEFNGHTFYSDTVSMDLAYRVMNTESYYDVLENQKKWREDMKCRDEEHKKAIPTLTKEWIEKGHKVLAKDKWDMWDKCVPIRLSDLYEGMELGTCLDIITTINEKSLEEAVIVMETQGHSGMSWALIKSMILEFSDKGEEFCKFLDY